MKRIPGPPARLFLLLISSATHAADFKFPTQTLTVPEGFTIEIAADSSLVSRPIAGSFDEQGRLYVTDSSGQSGKAPAQLEAKSHRVLRLEDSKGAGHFDKGAVFATGMMFPEGCLWSDGALFVAAVPQIWKISGGGPAGISNHREVWFDGKTITGCANDLHGPYAGPDGWLYWCKGAFSEQTYERPGKPPFVTRASHIFRARPDGSGIEPVLTGGMDNPVGVAFTSTGERFLTATFLEQPALGRRDGIIHAIYGGVYGKVHDVIDDHPQTGGLLPPMVHLGAAAPCGIAVYKSRVFGPDSHDNLFVCCFNLHKVTRHVLIPDGATFRTQDSDFVSSDSPDFHPTDVIEDADGSLLVIDTGGWYKMCCPTSQLSKPDVLGAIYRVRRTGAPQPDDARGLKLAWETMPAPEMAALLGAERVAVRERAMRELARKGAEGVPALRDLIAESPSADARRDAVWTLTRIDLPAAREAARGALTDRDESVRHAAIHSISVWRDTAANDALLSIQKEGGPELRRVAAEALGRIGNEASTPDLLAAAAVARDRVGEHSAIYALIEIADAEGTRAGLSAPDAGARRAALIALDQMPGHPLKSEDVTPLLDSSVPVLEKTAGWIVSHHSEWGDALASHYRTRLNTASPDEKADAELSEQISRVANAPAIQKLLTDAVEKNAPVRVLHIGLDVMAAAGLKETPAAWLERLSQILTSDNPTVLRPALVALRSLTLPKQPPAELIAALTASGQSPETPADLRLDALNALPAGSLEVPPDLLGFLIANLAATQPLPMRSAAASVLAKARLTPAQLTQLLSALPSAGPLELPKLLVAFERAPEESLGLALVAALGQRTVGVRASEIKALLSKYPESVKQAGVILLARIDADFAQQAAHLDELAKSISGGDVRRGQAVFLKTGCIVCHSMGYLGGKLGPDLTRIGAIRTERDLLESIVYPSASFVRSYEPMVATTRTGDQFTGILRKDSPEEIVLATGPETEQRLARADLRDLQPGTVSLMPQGFEQALSRQELADLISFLRAAK